MEIALYAAVGCGCAVIILPIIAAIVSGRRRQRSDWLGFCIGVAIPIVLLVGSAVYMAHWNMWRVYDENVERYIRMTSATLVLRTDDTDLYEARGDWDIRRPRFRPEIGLVIAASVVFGVTLPALALAIRRFVPRAKDRPGLCRKCGYNLTGAPHERCPECGEGVPTRAQGRM